MARDTPLEGKRHRQGREEEEAPRAYLRRVRRYYRRARRAYLEHVGETWQAGRIRVGKEEPSARDSNLALAELAGVRPGEHLFDAGCGVGGPAIDIAGAFEGVRVEGLTLGYDQARTARELVEAAGLAGRVRIHVGDFHAPPFPSNHFDRALFFESNGYLHDAERAFAGVRRVLRPGGSLYIKGVFLKEGPLTAEEERERLEVDRLYAHRTGTVKELLLALQGTGWRDIETRRLETISDRHYNRAMYLSGTRDADDLTEHGRLHHRDFQCLSAIFYHEIRARRPLAGER